MNPTLGTLRRFASAALLAVAATILIAARWNQASAQSYTTLPMPPDLPRPDESGRVPVNDIEMWYAVFNKNGGDPVLLIHGGLGSADGWGFQIPVLVKTYEVIVADSRGHGRSTRSKRPIGYEVMTDDYVALLNHLKVKKVALVGQSDGAIIGLDMAMRYPERLSKLFAFGGNFNVAGLRDDPPDEKDAVWGPVFAKARKDYERLSPTPTEYDSFSKAIIEMWNSQPDYKAEELARIKTATVIADGEHEEFIKLDHTRELARLVPGSELLILPGVGHLAKWQNSELFNSELMRFLNGTPK